MWNKLNLVLAGAAIASVAISLWVSVEVNKMLAAKIESLKPNDTEVQPDGVN